MEFDDITFAEYSKKRKKKKIFWTTFLIIFLVGSFTLLCAILLIPAKKGATAREWLEAGIDESEIDNVYKINFISTYEEEDYICYIYEFYRLEDGSTADEKFDNIVSDIDFYKTKEIKYVAYISFKNPKIIFENKEAKHYTYCIDFDIVRILE